jgi:hypothetical protein
MKKVFLSALTALPFLASPAFAGGVSPSTCSSVGQGYSLNQVRSTLGTNGDLTSTTSFMGTVSTGYNFKGNGTCIVSFQNGRSMMSMYLKF